MLDFVITFFTKIIEVSGYTGVALLMVLESMVLPVPSEAIMPFAGFAWYKGSMSFWLIVIAGTAGSLVGSLVSYYIGYYGGAPFIKKYGRYLLLNESHLEQTHAFFGRYGGKAIFVGRMIPVVRHLISLPAGTGKMNIFKFIFYTVTGAAIWNAFLTYLGYLLGESWGEIRKYTEVLDVVLLVVILGGIIYWIYKRRSVKK